MEHNILQQAARLLDERYRKPIHTVAAVLVAKDGTRYEATNIDHFSGYVCAEMAALSNAINSGALNFDLIGAVRKNADLQTSVANPCGKCRQILHDYAPGVKVFVADDENITQKTIEELLPYPFTRQKEKILESRMTYEVGDK